MVDQLQDLDQWARDAGLSVHWVLADPKKRPLEKGWQKTPAAFSAVVRHVKGGGLAGFMPFSLRLVCIDVDKGGQDTVAKLSNLAGPPLVVCPSGKQDNFHCYYRYYRIPKKIREVGNAQWFLPGSAERRGEIRESKGYVVLWHPGLLVEGLQKPGHEIDRGTVERLKTKSGIPAPAEVVPQGQRNETLNKEVFQATVNGQPEEAERAKARARASGLSGEEIQTTAASAAAAGKEKQKTKKGKTLRGLSEILAHYGIAFRRNVRGGFREKQGDFKGRAKGNWERYDDDWETALRVQIESDFLGMSSKPTALRFGRERFDELLSTLVDDRRVDPFREWLERLPKWDSRKRLESLLLDTFGLDPGEANQKLAQWASRFLCLGPIWRCYHDGEKLDEMPVLIGVQGVGKSTIGRLLFPASKQEEWFADRLDLSAPKREWVEAFSGKVLLEAAEMDGISRADVKRLKGNLSATSDHVRKAYGRNAETFNRKAVILGTSDNDSVLPNDPEGLRRFVPVRLLDPCPNGGHSEKWEARSKVVAKVRAYLDEHREQLWAEGLDLYRLKVPARLPDCLKGDAAALAETARTHDTIMEEALDQCQFEAGKGYKLIEIAAEVQGHSIQSIDFNSMTNTFRLAAAMRQAGWVKVKPNNRKRWTPPASACAPEHPESTIG